MDDENESLEGIGVHHMWGFSQAFNCQAIYESNQPKSSIDSDQDHSDEPLNILLSNPSDIRHVLMTLSQRRRHARRPLHFYLLDGPIEVLARHLLLLSVATDWEIPVRQRTNTFLEIFGNTLVQRRTAHYIAQQGKALESLLCDGVGNETLKSMLDFSLLKYRERDQLQTVFQSWSINNPYDAEGLHNRRQRILYKDRYDFRKNVVDWDYQWSLKPIGSVVHVRQYRTWRNTGIAFEFGDQQYVRPNRSLSSYAEGKEKGRSMMRRGYWCDLVCSPFVSVGLDCATPNEHAEELFDIYNQDSGSEQHRHHTVEIAVYNVMSWLYEIETGNVYRMARSHDIYSGLGEKKKKKKDKVEKDVAKEEKNEPEEKKEEEVAEVEVVEKKKNVPVVEKEVVEETTLTTTDKPNSNEKFTKVSVGKLREVDSDDDVMTDDEEESSSKDAGDIEIEIVEDNVEDTKAKQEAEEIEAMKLWKIKKEEDAAAAAAATAASVAAAAALEEEEEVLDPEELEKAHARALKRAATIVEVLSNVKVFVVGQTLNQIMERPKKKFTNLFDMCFLANKAAHVLHDERFPYLCKKKNAVVCIETAKYVIPLEKKTKQIFVERVDGMAKKMKASKGKVQPVFWNRTWSKESAAERRAKKRAAELAEAAANGEAVEEDEDNKKEDEEKKSKKASEIMKKSNGQIDLDGIPSVVAYCLPELK